MIRLRLHAGTDRMATYRIAGTTLAADSRPSVLEPFLLAPESPAGHQEDSAATEAAASRPRQEALPAPFYTGPAWLGERWREMKAHRQGGLYRLHAEGADPFTVTDSGEIQRLGSATEGPISPATAKLALEIALGPALLLALASRGAHALHASAVGVDGRAVAFVGESGAGTSTLARPTERLVAWRRWSDDILPVGWQGRPRALPHFPQLKLGEADQYRVDLPAERPLGAVYCLSPAAASGPTAEIQPLDRREATLALVRHTVASKLFDRSMQSKLFDRLTRATATLPVLRLAYARDLGRLDALREAILSDARQRMARS